MSYRIPAALAASKSPEVFRWFVHLGGIGLIPLGILDSSVVPIPGSMDVATILLAARDPHLWFFYALMATAGAVAGGYLTFRIARKGGQAAMEKRLSRKTAKKVQNRFERWGFWAIFVPALLPPPLPLVPFLVAAGALQYPRVNYLLALGLGRVTRYLILAFLGAHYGHQIISFLGQHSRLFLYVGIGLGVAVTAALLLLRAHSKHQHKHEHTARKAA